MKTRKELAKEQLPEDVYEKYVRAVLDAFWNVSLDSPPRDYDNWLSGSFTWSKSKEGHEYWEGINDKYIDK